MTEERIGLCLDSILDSSAVVGFLLQEHGWKAVHRAVQRPEVYALLPGPVLTESIEVARRKGNQSSPTQIHAALSAFGMRVVLPVDEDLLRAAELMEISNDNPGPPHPRTNKEATLSLGDALVLAITERLACMVLTKDVYWKWMVDQGLIDVKVAIP